MNPDWMIVIAWRWKRIRERSGATLEGRLFGRERAVGRGERGRESRSDVAYGFFRFTSLSKVLFCRNK